MKSLHGADSSINLFRTVIHGAFFPCGGNVTLLTARSIKIPVFAREFLLVVKMPATLFSDAAKG
jgi:hypothetical protein